jgi:hypothetical protein
MNSYFRFFFTITAIKRSPLLVQMYIKNNNIIDIGRQPLIIAMGKNRQKIFLSAVVSGIALIMGLPGLADLLSFVWETTRAPLEQGLPAQLGWIISMISLSLFFAITILNYDIYLKGLRKGKKGLLTVITGVALGVIIGSAILAILYDFLS